MRVACTKAGAVRRKASGWKNIRRQDQADLTMEAARQAPDGLSFSSFCGPQPGGFQGPDYGKL